MSLEDVRGLYDTYYHDDISQINHMSIGQTQNEFLSSILQTRNNSRKNTVGEISTSKIK